MKQFVDENIYTRLMGLSTLEKESMAANHVMQSSSNNI